MSTDESARPRLDAIQARAAAATEGPWEEVAWIAPDGRRYDALVGPNGLDVCEVPRTPQGSTDAAFIAHARQDVPALTAVVHDVLALHRPEPRYFIGDDEYLFDSPEDASDWDEARALVERLDVCSHCRSIEVGLDGDDGQMGYDPDATYWPCQTVRAITAHIDVTSPTPHDLTDTRGPRA